MFVGIKYLYGTRIDKDLQTENANRLQMRFGFYLSWLIIANVVEE